MATLAELQAELLEINAALSNIRKGGQSYTITAGTAGTSRMVTQADYNTLTADKQRIEAQIASLRSGRSTRFLAGW